MHAYCTHMSTQPLRLRVAAEVRAEMARQKRTGTELANALHCSQQSASRKINTDQGLSLDDLPAIADWLGVEISSLVRPQPLGDAA